MEDNEFIKAYKRVFPFASPSIFQLEMIAGRIQDKGIWNQVLEFWAGNDYRPQSIFKMCNYYDELMIERGKKASFVNVGRYIANGESEYPDCKTCDNTRRIGDWTDGIDCPDCVGKLEKAA